MILCAVGFVVGLINAIVGVAGMLTMPTLLTSGLPSHFAFSTKLDTFFSSFIASLTFLKIKSLDPVFESKIFKG